MTLADVLNGTVLLFGGPAVVLAVGAGMSAYHSWRLRRLLEQGFVPQMGGSFPSSSERGEGLTFILVRQLPGTDHELRRVELHANGRDLKEARVCMDYLIAQAKRMEAQRGD